MNLPYYNPNYKLEPVRSCVGWKTLKKEIYRFCCCMFFEDVKLNVFSLNLERINPDYMPVWKAFEKYGFNLDKFMEEKGYELIENVGTRNDVLMAICFPLIKQPISMFVIDWLNCYLDFFERDKDLRWENGSEITDTEILRRLFYCRTEKEIWALMGKGIGDIQDLYAWYKGEHRHRDIEELTGTTCRCVKDDKKAEEMLNYFIESPDVIEKVRRLARLMQIFSTEEK